MRNKMNWILISSSGDSCWVYLINQESQINIGHLIMSACWDLLINMWQNREKWWCVLSSTGRETFLARTKISRDHYFTKWRAVSTPFFITEVSKTGIYPRNRRTYGNRRFSARRLTTQNALSRKIGRWPPPSKFFWFFFWSGESPLKSVDYVRLFRGKCPSLRLLL